MKRRQPIKGVDDGIWILTVCFLLAKFSVACDALSLKIILNSNVYSNDPKISLNHTPSTVPRISFHLYSKQYRPKSILCLKYELPCASMRMRMRTAKNRNKKSTKSTMKRQTSTIFAQWWTHIDSLPLPLLLLLNYLNCRYHPMTNTMRWGWRWFSIDSWLYDGIIHGLIFLCTNKFRMKFNMMKIPCVVSSSLEFRVAFLCI